MIEHLLQFMNREIRYISRHFQFVFLHSSRKTWNLEIERQNQTVDNWVTLTFIMLPWSIRTDINASAETVRNSYLHTFLTVHKLPRLSFVDIFTIYRPLCSQSVLNLSVSFPYYFCNDSLIIGCNRELQNDFCHQIYSLDEHSALPFRSLVHYNSSLPWSIPVSSFRVSKAVDTSQFVTSARNQKTNYPAVMLVWCVFDVQQFAYH